MDKRDINESIRIVQSILEDISENNNTEMKQTKKLHRLSLNLKIVGVQLPAIKPLVNELQMIIDSLNQSTSELVKTKRLVLRYEWECIKEYIKENEKKL